MANIGAAGAAAEERSTHGGQEVMPEQLPRGHEAMARLQNCEATPPCALPAADIPRVVILDENAVYDHYMRRLNRVWARRMKASRRKNYADRDNQSNLPGFVELDSRPVVRQPTFIKEMEKEDEHTRPRRRRPSSGTEHGLNQPRGIEHARAAGSRPNSAPVLTRAPSKAWVDVRDRTHAARGPGPTSSRYRCHHGDSREEKNLGPAGGRPDSAPTLHRGSRSQTVVASRARSSSRPLKASAWLPSRVTRLERETHDLLTACRKAGRCKGDAARGYSATSHFGRTADGTPPPRSGERRRNVEHSEAYELFWSDEKIENLGRGAVVRLIGNLGMGRYAHRFRAFAVTGSDLASCTEEDLVQIGVSFRPHRLRLLKEIARRKETRDSTSSRGREKRRRSTVVDASATDGVVRTNSTAQQEHDGRPEKAIPALELQKPMEAVSTSHTKGKTDALHDAPPTALTNEVIDSSSTSTACTPYEDAVPSTVDSAPIGPDYASTPRAAGNNTRPSTANMGDGEREVSPSALVGVSEPLQLKGRNGSAGVDGDDHPSTRGEIVSRQHQAQDSSMPPGGGGLVDFVLFPDASAAARGGKMPGLKGTLQMSGVRAGGMKLAIGDNSPFLQVKACDQLRRTSVVTGTGAEASWDDAVLSFSVTDQALTSDGVLIELCCGNVGSQDLVARGNIPGDVTMRLICRLRSKNVGRGRARADDNVAGDSASANGGISLTVEVRLFAEPGGKDAGVCTLNLNFRQDEGEEVANGVGDAQLPGYAIQDEAQRKIETTEQEQIPLAIATPGVTATACQTRAGAPTDGAERRQSSLVLLQETARHIKAIEEVCQLVRQQHELADGAGQPEGGDDTPILASQTQSEPPASTIGQREAEVDSSNRQETQAAEEAPHPQDEGILTEEEAAIILQSHTRRRAAKKASKRRVKERTAAKRVQAFARQRMQVSKVRKARERELMRMEQKRSNAVVRIQSTARRRIATNDVQRRRSEEADLRETQAKRSGGAACILQGFTRRRLSEKSRRRKHRAATTLQGISGIREAKAEVRRWKAQKQLRAKREKEKDDAALQIQSFARRRKTSHEQRLARSRKRSRAAVKLQSMARSRSVQSHVRRKRARLALLKTVARVAVKEVLQQGVELCVAIVMEEKGRPAPNVRGQGLTNAEEGETGDGSWSASKQPSSEAMVASALILNAYDQQHTKADGIRDASQSPLSRETEVEGGTNPEGIAAISHRASDGSHTHNETSASDLQEFEAESLRKAEMLAAAEEQRAAARRIQRLCRKRFVRRRNNPPPHASPAVVASARTSHITQELTASRKYEGAATRIQQAFRGWCLARQVRTLIERKTQAAIAIQLVVRRRVAVRRVACLTAKRKMEIETEAGEIARGKAAVRIQRAVRTRQARNLVGALKRERDAESQLKLREAEQRQAVQSIQCMARSNQARRRVSAMRQERGIEHQRAQELAFERQRAAEQEAAVSIQRAARGHHAVKHVNALRQERDIEIQRDQEAKMAMQAEMREQATSCIQRAVRCRRALARVSALTRERDAESQLKLREAEQRQAVQSIQCMARSNQARRRVSATRQERGIEHQRAQELAFERQRAAEQEAAVSIQRAARGHHAVKHVNALRQERDIEIQRDQEAKMAMQAEMREQAASCIQRAVRCRRALARVPVLTRERDVERQRELYEADMEREAEVRRNAAECIQRAVRFRQAIKRVSALRRRRNADIERQLEQESEPVSLKFAKMMAAARRASGVGLGIASTPLPPELQPVPGMTPSPDLSERNIPPIDNNDGYSVQNRREATIESQRDGVEEAKHDTQEIIETLSAARQVLGSSEPPASVVGIEQRGMSRKLSSSSEGTESSTATGLDTEKPELSDGHDGVIDTQEGPGEVSMHGEDVASSSIDKLLHGKDKENDTTVQVLSSGDNPSVSSSGDDGDELQPSEDVSLHTPLVPARGDPAASTTTVPDRPPTISGDQTQNVPDIAFSAVPGPESTDGRTAEIGTAEPSPPRSIREEGTVERQRTGPSAAHHTEHGDVVAEHPTTGEDVSNGWERHLDEETGATYYFHPETRVTSWDLPSTTVGGAGEEGHTPQNGRETLVSHDNGGEGETSQAGSAAVDVAVGTVATGEGRLLQEGPTGDDYPSEEGVGESGKDADMAEEVAATTDPSVNEEGLHAYDHEAGGNAEEGDEWQEIVDPDSGSSYFYNPSTRQSTWSMPAAVVAMAAAAAAATVVTAAVEPEGAVDAG